jgi:5-methylcytosine-specific restriction endonuclease McrA
VKDLVARERAVTLEILLHLIEVERRRLYLGLGYPSMFEYATRRLGYSESAAARRIRAARCVRDYPEVCDLLERNEVNLVIISLVASVLTATNAKDVLGKIRGKSQREVEAIAATYRPPVSTRDRATPVCVAVPVPSAPQLNGPRGYLTATAGSEKRPNTPASGFAAGPFQAPPVTQAQSQTATHPSAAQPSLSTTAEAQSPGASGLERKFQMQFLASERFMKKFERAMALLSNRNGAMSYEAVLEAALDELLKDHDPDERRKRREERKVKADARTKTGNRPTNRAAADGGASRRIPAAVRDAVFARDEGRCPFVGSNGRRCETTHHLQVDHIFPYTRGGTNTLGNLRLLCERHNKLEAERVLGENVIRRFRRRE